MANLSRRIFSVALLTLGLAALAAASGDLKVDLEPVFQGNLSVGGVMPIAADIQNSGGDTSGVLRVFGDNSQTDYPVELPRGAHKRIVTYPTNQYGDLVFELLTDKGRVETRFPNNVPRGEGSHVLMISDLPGELGFLSILDMSITSSQRETSHAPTMFDCYVKPEDAPIREIGYTGASVIVLGSGAERLTDEAVQAIKLWVSTGGTLFFIGGVSTPILNDHRWTEMLPVTGFKVTELKKSSALNSLAFGSEEQRKSTDQDFPGATITTAKLVAGATAKREGEALLWADLAHGLGKSVYLSFNPFEAPFPYWNGRNPLMSRLFRLNTNLQAGVFLQNFSLASGQFDMAGPMESRTATSGIIAPSHVSSIENDPFSMQLPPTEKIFMVLAGYFIVVVPLNFLVLKKLKRGELAWFTAPVISLGFAGLLFTSAGSLYKAKMSTVNDGVIIAQEGDTEGMFIGNTQMFIPRAGTYDLKLKNVDALGGVESPDYAPYGGSSRDSTENGDITKTDVGEVEVPGMPANNLAFRRLTYRQLIPLNSWLHVQLEKTGEHTARCEISNTSRYWLHNASLVVGVNLRSLGDIAPGNRQAVDVTFKTESISETDKFPSVDVRQFTLNKPRVALTGQLDGFRPGPQLGENIPGRSQIEVALFSAWKGGVK